jgi:hypothetical protein
MSQPEGTPPTTPLGPVSAQGGQRTRNLGIGYRAAGQPGPDGLAVRTGSAGAAEASAAAGAPGAAAGAAVRPGSAPRLTSRGCALVMFVVFLGTGLLAQLLSAAWIGGLGYGAGCLLAVAFARRAALLFVSTAPPLIFLIALVCAQLITATGSTLLATAEGTVLALAAASGWLFACTAGCIVLAVLRGLPQAIRDLSAQINGRPVQQAAGSLSGAGAPRQLGPGSAESDRPGPRRLALDDEGPDEDVSADDDASPDGLTAASLGAEGETPPTEPGAQA